MQSATTLIFRLSRSDFQDSRPRARFTFTVTVTVETSPVQGTVTIDVAADGDGQVRYIQEFLDDEQVSSANNSKDNPEVAALGDGGHIVVWSSYFQDPDNSDYGVFAQRYDANGDKVGSEFLVNTTTASDQLDPSVVGISGGDQDGGFVVVWQSANQVPDSSGNGIFAQRYNADGTKSGGEILVNETTTGSQQYPSVTALAGGQFAVSWTDYNGTDGSSGGVFVRLFDADGSPQGGEIQVNQTTVNSQETEGWVAENITTLDDGGFVVSWRSYDGNDVDQRYDAYMRVFNDDGSARTPEIQTNSSATNTNGDQYYVSVGALVGENAGFVVTWSDPNSIDGSGWGVFARIHDQNGDPVGDDFQVNSFTTSTQIYSKVAGLDDGGFVILWQSRGVDGFNDTIVGQRYDAAGQPVDGEFIVPESSFSNETEPSIALRDDGALIAVWEADGNRIEQKIITDFATDVRPIDILDDDQVSSANTSKDNPEVAALGDGGHIVVWSSINQAPDSSGWGVFAQRYDANGDKIGGEFLVNTTISSDQFDPSVAGITGGDQDGGFVVVWQSANQAPDSSGYGVFAQRFNADGNAAGGEILINETTTGSQLYPSVTALADGHFAVSWTDSNGTDGSGNGVFVRLFTADGSPQGGEIQVNQTTASSQETEGWAAETITTLDDGGFVVSWRSYDGNDVDQRYDAYMRVFNANGSARTPEIQTNSSATNTNGHQYYVSVGALVGENAGFVVTWSDPNSIDGSGWGVFARIHDQNGDPVGDDFQVNSFTTSTQIYSKVAGLDDGGFVILWQSRGVDGFNDTIVGQRYDAAGQPVDGEFIVPESSFSNETEPSIALRDDGALIAVWEADGNRIEQKIITDFATDVRPIDVFDDEQVSSGATSKDIPEVAALGDGGHIVVWSSINQAPDGSNWGVFAQRYDANGDKVAGEFLVNTTTASTQIYASVAGITGGAEDGGFIVAWHGNGPGDGAGIFAQLFDPDGNKVGGELLVNETTTGSQYEPTVTALAEGKFAVTWTDNGTDGSSEGVFLRLFNADGSPQDGEIQVNQTTTDRQRTDGFSAETITTLDDGGFVVSWASYDGSDVDQRYDAYMRVFNADGTARTPEFQVNSAATSTDNDQRHVSVGALVGTDAGFVVTWSDSSGTDGSNWGVFARIYDQDGDPFGDDFQVNSFTANAQLHSQVVGLDDGGFAILWHSYGADGFNYTISGQRYDADGDPVDGEFVVPESSFSQEVHPSIALRDDGALIAVWEADNNRIEQKIITDFGGGNAVAKNLAGGDGNDSFVGSDFADTIDGGGGNDRIEGLGGDDLLTGGSGGDVFVFGGDSGSDTIFDFEVGTDVFELEGGVTIANISEVDTTGDTNVDSTLVEFDDGSEVVLDSVLGTLNTGDLGL